MSENWGRTYLRYSLWPVLLYPPTWIERLELGIMWEVVELWHILAWPCVGIYCGLDNRGGGREESVNGSRSHDVADACHMVTGIR